MVTVGFHSKLEIGKVYTKSITTSKNGGYKGPVTFSVIKEATYEEWENDHPDLTEFGKFHAKESLKYGGHIYWVMVD